MTGNHWEMRNAFLGSAKPYRPELWVMGTGPKQIEIAAPHVDGVCSVAPSAWRTPEEARAGIESIRDRLSAAGRDPQAIKFGIVVSLLTHEDPAGLLSHAAVVARELDIPGVVDTRDATRCLRAGDRVRVDGRASTVDVLACAEV